MPSLVRYCPVLGFACPKPEGLLVACSPMSVCGSTITCVGRSAVTLKHQISAMFGTTPCEVTRAGNASAKSLGKYWRMNLASSTESLASFRTRAVLWGWLIFSIILHNSTSSIFLLIHAPFGFYLTAPSSFNRLMKNLILRSRRRRRISEVLDSEMPRFFASLRMTA
jgi:hypothetical protein